MQKIKDLFLVAIMLLMLILIMVFYNRIQFYKQLSAATPDTVYVPKPYEVTIIKREYIEKPVKVLVYPKDTALRKAVEQKDIVTGVSVTPQLLTIDKIKTNGTVFSQQYPLTSFREIHIDGQGNTEIKEKRHIGLKILGGILITGTAAYLIIR